MQEFRCDRGEIRIPKSDQRDNQIPTIDHSGFLKVDGYATRSGIFEYYFTDGTVRRELRPVEEVFKAESLRSLANVTLTNDHPPEMITPSNVKQYSVGFTGDQVGPNGVFIKVPLVIQDAQAIDDVESSRKRELSCGYLCDVEFTTGVFEGVAYDAVQRNIVYNHLAIVTDGRAGPEARIKMDTSGNEIQPIKEVREVKTDSQGETKMAKITIDRVEYEAPDALAKIVSEKLDSLEESEAEAKSSEAKVEELSGKVAGLESQLKEKEKEIEELKNAAPVHGKEDCMKLVKSRLDLEGKAKSFLEDGFTCDGLSDLEIKKKIAEKALPEMKFDDAKELFLDGIISGLAFKQDKVDSSDTEKNMANILTTPKNDGISSYAEAKRKYEEDSRNAWRHKETK